MARSRRGKKTPAEAAQGTHSYVCLDVGTCQGRNDHFSSAS